MAYLEGDRMMGQADEYALPDWPGSLSAFHPEHSRREDLNTPKLCDPKGSLLELQRKAFRVMSDDEQVKYLQKRWGINGSN